MPAEKYNAFISYAWVDNQPFEEGKTGWVSTFVDRLRKHLGRELGRKEEGDRVWLDYEKLRGSDNISRKIRDKLEASRLLVPIVSKGYLASRWCRDELDTFLQLHGPDSGRIFPVWMAHPTNDLPPPLGDLLKYKFWYEDDAKNTRTRWYPDIDPTDRDYGLMQQDMARDIAVRLREIMAAEPVTPSLPPVPDPLQIAPVGAARLVLVNGGEDDAELIRDIAQRLHRDHGLGSFVPISALSSRKEYKSSEITRDLRDKLGLASAVLILYKDGPLHQVHQQISEFLKVTLKPPKDRPLPTLDLCWAGCKEEDLGFYPPQMRVHPVDEACAVDCVRHFVGALSP